MKSFLFLAGVSLLAASAVSAQTAAPAPAPAAAATAPTVGATIMDSAGVTIGTVDSITPQAVVIATGATKVAVPPNAIGKTAKGFALSITKQQLDAAQAQQQQGAAASLQSRLVAGAAVNGLNGTPLGTIKSNDGANVTLTTSNGDAKLPLSGFAAGPNNTIVLGLTAEQLKAAMGGAATTGATTGATTTGTATAPATATGGTTTDSAATAPATTATSTTATTPTADATTSSSTKTPTKKKTTRR